MNSLLSASLSGQLRQSGDVLCITLFSEVVCSATRANRPSVSSHFIWNITVTQFHRFLLFTVSTQSVNPQSPAGGSIRHRQTSSTQTGPGPATAARSTSFQLFPSRLRWSSAKCRVVCPGASSQGAPKTTPRVDAGLSSCEGHGQATSTVVRTFHAPTLRVCLGVANDEVGPETSSRLWSLVLILGTSTATSGDSPKT